MKKKLLIVLITGLLMFGVAGMASATTFVEDFESAFPAWESGWLGTNSNLQNYYGVGGGRGNNPDGLWIHDGNWNDAHNAYITFGSAFASSITSFSLDIASHISDASILIYDKYGAILYSSLIAGGNATSDPGVYENHSVTSLNGISGFNIIGSYVEGNVGIDNVVVNTGTTPVPEPTTMLLLGLGLLGVAGVRRKFKR